MEHRIALWHCTDSCPYNLLDHHGQSTTESGQNRSLLLEFQPQAVVK